MVKAAREKVSQAYSNRIVLGAYPATRLETGYGTQPSLQQGEDFLIAQPVDFFNKSGAGRNSGTSQISVAKAALKQTELDVQAEVIEAYAQALSAQQLVTTAEALSALADQVYDATKKRVDVGDLAPAELLRSDLERQRARQTLITRRLTLQAAQTRFGAALGSVSATSVTLAPDDVSSILRLPGIGVENRPDVQSAIADVQVANADEDLGRSTAFPDFELQFRRAPWSQDEQYELRFQVIFNLWDHGASRERVRAAKSERFAAQDVLSDRRKKAAAELKATQLDLQAARGAVASFEKLSKDAQDLLDKEQKAYALGGVTLLDVLDATRALREIEESSIDAQLRLTQAASSYLSAGGAVVAP